MESHEAMPLQEVMSPTQGPASGIRNAGMTSGPSTTTADQVPSASMSHGRATFDAAVGQLEAWAQLVLHTVQWLQWRL